jgi:putative peptidoglycan lipid II flippase
VLGPTLFGDLYQATNNLPNLTYELLTGALFVSLVVPALVRHLDTDDVAAATRLANGFLTLTTVAALAVVALGVAAGPLVLDVLTAGAPEGPDGGTAWLLLALLLLQVPLYLLAGLAAAVQNARGRFALAAAAPSVENLGIVVVLLAYAVLAGGDAADGVGLADVLLLGAGTTGAVALHAAVQWAGARAVGVRLAPSRSWRDAEVRGLVRLAVPSMGYAGLNVVRYLCVLVVAAAVPGGVVAMTLAIAFYNLPVALGAKPVAYAALPALARAGHRADDQAYGTLFRRSLGLVLFLTVPAAVGYVLLSGPLAAAVSFGEMAGPAGRELVRVCLLGIGLGVAGEAALVLATQAAYARRDGAAPLAAVALRTTVAVAGMGAAWALLDGTALLLAVGAAVAVSDLLAAALLCLATRRRLPAAEGGLLPSVLRPVLASAAMAVVVVPLLLLLGTPVGPAAGVGTVVLAALVGAAAYLGAQWLLRAPELTGLRELTRRGPA